MAIPTIDESWREHWSIAQQLIEPDEIEYKRRRSFYAGFGFCLAAVGAIFELDDGGGEILQAELQKLVIENNDFTEGKIRSPGLIINPAS